MLRIIQYERIKQLQNKHKLKLILKQQCNSVRRYGLDLSGSGQGQVAGSCEHGNEPSGSVRDRSFLE
jgi:hypothetical protein